MHAGRRGGLIRSGGAAGALLLALSLAACAKPKPAVKAPSLPDGTALLGKASTAMSTVTSAHFSFTIKGRLASALPVRSADGVVTRDGKAQATAVLDAFGALVTYQVILVGGTAYLKGPTGPYQAEPAGNVYDVTQLLDPTNGLAGLLGRATGAKTVATTTISGIPCYEVQAQFPTTLLQGLTDLAPGQATVLTSLWIRQDNDQLIQFAVPFKIPNATAPTVLTAMLSDFNAPVTIQAPPTK